MSLPYAAPYDVVIAGAGPVGLLLACELRLAGLAVLILEQADDPHAPLKRLPFGMRGLSAPTIEAFYRRGLLTALTSANDAAAGAHWKDQARRPGGHFAGIQFPHDRIDGAQWPWRLPSPAGTSMVVEMARLEAVLAARAITLGVEIRRGLGVDGVAQSDADVTVRAGGETVRGRWLVGCDGGRSMVRKAGSFGFVGTAPEFTGYSVQVELANPGGLAPGRHPTPTGMFTFQPPGTIAMVDFDGGARHRTALTREHVEAVLRRVSDVDVTVTALTQATTWTDRAYQATTYRRGRVLLAGDAAHIHSPLGGQGLNLGLGDAMNLGWKLAATVRGDAPGGLLDSYATERHPIAAQVLEWSRAQVALMRPDPGSRALGAIVRDLIETGNGATYCAGRVWGVTLRYDLGGGHDLVGRSVPDFTLVDGTRIGALLGDGRGLVLDFAAQASLRTLAGRWGDRIRYIGQDVTDRLGMRALLVRPDGIVAWVRETGFDHEGAADAMARWFGEPAP